ncbi:MAG: hypothetical protein ACTHPS_21060 [Streptosporangiaceae bacterium]
MPEWISRGLAEPPVQAGEGDGRRQRPDDLGELGVRGGSEQPGDAGIDPPASMPPAACSSFRNSVARRWESSS